MHVLGHKNIAHQRKSIFGPDLIQDLRGEVSRPNTAPQSASLVARECNEMEIAAPNVALQVFRHKSEE